MPGVKSVHDSDEEKKDLEIAENDTTTDEDTESLSSSSSSSSSDSELDDDDASPEIEDEDCEKKLSECLARMARIQQHFQEVKEKILGEGAELRRSQTRVIKRDNDDASAHEFDEFLAEFNKDLSSRLDVSEFLRDLKMVNIGHVRKPEQ